MDARGAIAVAERQSYIGRIRDLCKMCAEAWVESQGGNAPQASKDPAAKVAEDA
jgi:glycyl-tRNA synthetase alpha chain